MNGLHGIIFANEERAGLKELVGPRCSASIPFGGRYRAVDFALSNMVNAGITDVGVVTHGQYQSLLDHLGTGKAWDLSRKRGGLRFLPPFNYDSSRALMPYRGNVEALAGIRSYLDTIRQDYVVLSDGDLVANLPINDIFAQHLETKADITVVMGADCFEIDDGTYFELDENNRVKEVLVHLAHPRGHRGLDTFIISTELLKQVVDDCTSRNEYSWRRSVLQARKDQLKIQAYIWNGYAAQIRSVQEYYDRSMQLLDPGIRADLFTPARPIIGKAVDKSSAYVAPSGHIANSLMNDGCLIAGTVENSILFSGVVVEEGAVVRGCILFRDAVVRKGAVVECIIGDKNVEIQENHRLMGYPTHPIVVEKNRSV
ncbi:MAG: glucose-1-phosphate adenylyltransferase subunit GlgD [Oscillibacter sp.]|nr:glucose-1-phosphate adenylyltransferase subunit GlgD [Oscillibacter sp.]